MSVPDNLVIMEDETAYRVVPLSEIKIIGELSETLGEIEIEWRITDFFSLAEEVDTICMSPEFYFSGSSWGLMIFPNGQTLNNSAGHVEVYAAPKKSVFPISATFSFGLKTAEGQIERRPQEKAIFKETTACGCSILQRSVLEERKSDLVPSNVLTVIFSLKHNDPSAVGISWFTRLQNLSSSLKDVLTGAKRTDVVLEVERGCNCEADTAENRTGVLNITDILHPVSWFRRLENLCGSLGDILTGGKRTDVVSQVEKQVLKAHRIILESRSPVFAAMFAHDMKENRTGLVDFIGMHPEAFVCVFYYIYCGEIVGMTFENVFDIYTAADMYYFEDLKQVCKKFIVENLSPDRFCEVIQFADLHQEEEMERQAKKYFRENIEEVMKTDSWHTFAKENLLYAVILDTPSTVRIF